MEHPYEIRQLEKQLDRLDEIAFEQHQDRKKFHHQVRIIRLQLKNLYNWMGLHSKNQDFPTYSVIYGEADNLHDVVDRWKEVLNICIAQIEEIEAE